MSRLQTSRVSSGLSFCSTWCCKIKKPGWSSDLRHFLHKRSYCWVARDQCNRCRQEHESAGKLDAWLDALNVWIFRCCRGGFWGGRSFALRGGVGGEVLLAARHLHMCNDKGTQASTLRANTSTQLQTTLKSCNQARKMERGPL